MDTQKELLKELKALPRQPIIHNTEASIRRMQAVFSQVPWRGRELALKQEERIYE